MTPSISVAQYLTLINQSLRVIPPDLVVEGEVSDYRVAQGKWVSFDLKDEEAQAVLKCFMTTWQLTVAIEDGMRVQVKGYPKVYERFGTLKFNVVEIEPVGEGALKRAYELLKGKLEAEGLFDAARKRELPRFPSRIGLITSRDAAAYGDFLRILNNRWGGTRVEFAHVHVQGREAVDDILQAFSTLCALESQPDVIVLTRGGGGLEDLHAFNDERVARAVYASRIPVVCAVGHERDEALCEYVADVRASTPSNAAERCVPSREEVNYEIGTMVEHMEGSVRDTVAGRERLIGQATSAFGVVVGREQNRLARLREELARGVEGWIPRLRERLLHHERVLRELDPKRVLSRGYSIVKRAGRVVRDAVSLDVGGEVTLQFAAGSVDAEVIRINGRCQQKLV